ncbi:hypothetical protein [Nostoc sp. NMS4]|nr:hypothetical protein [Nostoc sp. NMS4]
MIDHSSILDVKRCRPGAVRLVELAASYAHHSSERNDNYSLSAK